MEQDKMTTESEDGIQKSVFLQVRTEVDKTTYNAIDLMKFICAIFVITIHVAPFGSPEEISVLAYLNFGLKNYVARLAVPFFFVASGFFLYRKTTLREFNVGSTKKFCLKTLRLYLIWTLIFLPLIIRKIILNDGGILQGFLFFLRDFLFSGSYTHLWYLNSLIVAVVIISFLLYKKVSPKVILVVSCILYVIGLFAQSWFGFIKPLEGAAPFLWSALILVQKVIVTTRNGLFFGFLFVSIGMCFAFYDFKLEKKISLIGFIVSMLLLFGEAFVLEHFDIAREHDMYLFLVPAVFFMFSFIKTMRLQNSPVYKTLRSYSSLIFYGHLWVEVVVGSVLKLINEPLGQSSLNFIFTLLITILMSVLVVKLSSIKRFRWLKFFY